MVDVKIASGGERLRASIVDGFVLFPLYVLDQFVGSAAENQTFVFVYNLLLGQVGWLYMTLMHGWRGQTLGKMCIGIKVVKNGDAGAIGFKRAALRDSPYIAMVTVWSVIWIWANVRWFMGVYTDADREMVNWAFKWMWNVNYGWFVVEMLTMLMHPRRRAVHDLIAGTIVVRGVKAS